MDGPRDLEETMHFDPEEGIAELDTHLDRLKDEAERQGFKFDRHESSGIGLTWSDPHGLSVGVGFVNTGRSDSNRLFIGAGYTIGGSR